VVSRLLPTTKAQARAQVKSVGFLDKAALGQGFSECVGLSRQSFIPPTAPQSSSSSIIQCWYNTPIRGLSNGGLSFTPAH
jgi:hypothetical protein